MAEQEMIHARKYDPALSADTSKNPYASPYYGLWYKEIIVKGTERRFYLYTPKSYFPQMRHLSVFLPPEISPECFLQESGWREISEAENILLILCVPGASGYESGAQEQCYFKAVHDAVFNDPEEEFAAICCDQCYLSGAGSGADAALWIALSEPKRFSGVSLYAPGEVGTETLSALGARLSTNGRNEAVPGWFNRNCPLPAWLSLNTSGNDALVRYLQRANHTEPQAYPLEGAVFYREKPGILNDTRTHKPVSRLFIRRTGDPLSDFLDREVTALLFRELFGRIVRFPEDPYGALRTFVKPEELGVKRYEKRMAHAAHEKPVKRLFALYVPSSYDGSRPMPLVVATHGFTATYEYFFRNTEFWRVAEERGFLVAFTQATPNDGSRVGTPRWRSGALMARNFLPWQESMEALESEIAYFRWVVEQVKADYRVDTERIYCTGHSNGSQMTYCLSELMKDVFAASAQVGFPIRQYASEEDMPAATVKMPALDIECSDDRETDPEDPESGLYWELLYRQKENGLDPAAPRMTRFDHGCVYGRSYTNEQGYPLVVYGCWRNACHAYFPDIAYFVWDEFFCNYSRDADGTSRYRGEVIR